MLIMKNGRKVCLLVLVVIAGLVLSPHMLMAQAKAEEMVVYVLLVGPMTGPAGSLVTPVFTGCSDYFSELNAKGGIEGVKVDVIIADDRYEAARAVTFYQRYRKLPKLVFGRFHGTSSTLSLAPVLHRDKLPFFGAGGGENIVKPGTLVLNPLPYCNQLGAAIDWMLADWGKKGKPGKPVLGFMSWDSTYKGAFNGGAEYAKQKGVKFLPPELFPPTALKHDTWLIRLGDEGANYVWILGADPSQTFIVRDAYNLGLSNKIQFMSSVYGLNDLVGLKLVEPKQVEGAVVGQTYIVGDESRKHPMANLYTKYQKKPLEEMPAPYLIGVAEAMVMEKAISMALKEVGYERIKGEDCYNALLKVRGDVTQGITGKIAITPERRVMTDSLKFYQITNGKPVAITDWVKVPDTVSLATYQ